MAYFMNAYLWLLTLAIFLSGLMAGFLFAFAAVVMPGLKELNSRDYLRAFCAIDGVIQRGQPMFMLVWLGPPFTLVLVSAMAFASQSTLDQVVTASCATANIVLVQLPTVWINIPLNNRVQSLDLSSLDDDAASQERETFESRWNRWNNFRTVVSCVILAVLLLLLVQT